MANGRLPLPRLAPPLPERLALRTAIDQQTGCHVWTGARKSAGYGQIQIGGKSMLAHRVSYAMHHGPIPAGLEIDHLCRNPSCINPDHLEAVTQVENRRRCTNVQRTVCRHGHEMTADNTSFVAGRRLCRECNRIRSRESYHRAKSKASDLGVVFSDGQGSGVAEQAPPKAA